MSKKCICFLRVSTTQQDLQVQEDRVIAIEKYNVDFIKKHE